MRKPYIIGRHKAQCDICGRTRRDDELRIQWDGLMACRDRCWSPKHPNEYPRQVPNDGLPVANARPRRSISTMPTVDFGGTTQWEDPTLLWETPLWIWDDDLSSVSLTSLIR